MPLLLGFVLTARADTVHVVQTGDSLFRIALQYGTTVDAIVQANNLINANLIIVGQELVIPGATGTAAPAPAAPAPAAPAAPASTGTAAPVTADAVHVVVPGDSMFRISVNYGVPVADIAAANNIVNPSLIYVGQELLIPGATVVGAPAAPVAQAPAPVAAGSGRAGRSGSRPGSGNIGQSVPQRFVRR